jgi:glutamate carboxypeptidase
MDPDPEPDSEPGGAAALTSGERELCEAVNAAFERVQVPWLAELVDRPSATAAAADVDAAAAWIDGLAEGLGLHVERVPDPAGRFADHRVYATAAARARDVRAPLLVGHVDTVHPRSAGFLRFHRGPGPSEADGGPAIPELLEGRPVDALDVFGPGVLDMKGGLSVMLFAWRALRAVAPSRASRLPLRWIVVTDEEVGSPSSAPLYAALAPATPVALVFEAGRAGDKLVTRRKGSAAFDLCVVGRAAHAGNDHGSGRNAIHGLALLVPRVEALTDPERGVTVNVGRIEGGTARNTVPARASCAIDVRFVDDAGGEAAIAGLRALASAPLPTAGEARERLEGLVVTLEGGISRPPQQPLPGTAALRLGYEACARAVGLGGGEAPLQGGGSDANLLAAHGVPVIDGLGPYGREFHSPKEWARLDSLRAKTQALALWLWRYYGLDEGEGPEGGGATAAAPTGQERPNAATQTGSGAPNHD